MSTIKTTKLFFLTLSISLFISCKQKKSSSTEENSIVNKEAFEPITNKNKELNIEDYFPGSNFMKIVFAENNELNLTDAQLRLFTEWRTENQSKVADKNRKIADLEIELKTLSVEGSDMVKLLDQAQKINILRIEVAQTKVDCRQLLLDNLEPQQWQTLVSAYEKEYPFKERTKMMDVITHVNPVPNYMSVINANISELSITPSQKKVLDSWSDENHSKMMKMANAIIAMEKEIYETSLKEAAKESILTKFEEINSIRTQILEKKTNCRNLVKKTISEKQWAVLVSKIK
tara:strand:- start:2002 stop:2868 length:867 start_codon:yes stop_codon:yes gene_type:complete